MSKLFATGNLASTRPSNFNLAFGCAVSLNLAFIILEWYYAVISHSMGLLADAVHNLSDIIGLMMAWASSLMLKFTASGRYSYGYKKLTILAAFANAILLLMACGYVLYGAIPKLFAPIVLQEKIIIKLALLGTVVNGVTALLFSRGKNEDLNIKGAYLHLLYDSLTSLGVALSGIVIYYTEFYLLDPIFSLVIVVIILKGTWGLLSSSLNLILGAVPEGIDHNLVKAYLEKIPGVQKVHDLHIWGLSTLENALTAHLVVPTQSFSDENYLTINQHLRQTFKIHHVTLQIEKGEKKFPCQTATIC